MSVGWPPTITLSSVLIMRFQDALDFLAIWVILQSLRGENLQLEWAVFFQKIVVTILLISGAAHWQPATCRFKVTSCCTSPTRWLIDEQHNPRCLQAASLCLVFPLSDTTKCLFCWQPYYNGVVSFGSPMLTGTQRPRERVSERERRGKRHSGRDV